MKREGVTAVLIFIWAMLFTEMVKAATLSEFMGGYDNNLIYFASATFSCTIRLSFCSDMMVRIKPPMIENPAAK